MFVSFRKCSRPLKPDPISDHNCQNLYPFSDQNGSKTIPFGAAHTYIPYIGEYPRPHPGGGGNEQFSCDFWPCDYFTVHVSDSLKFSISLSARGVAEVSSHNFQIKSVCFERLIKSLDSVFGNAWQNPINWPLRDIEMKSTSDTIFTDFHENRT